MKIRRQNWASPGRVSRLEVNPPRRSSGVDHHQKNQGFAPPRIAQRVRRVRPIRRRVPRVQQVPIPRNLHRQLPLDHGDEFPRPHIVRRAHQGPAPPQGHFIKLHVLFQMQRTQSADPAVPIRSIVKGAVVFPDHRDRRRGTRGIDQVVQRHPKGLGDAQSHS